MSQPSARLQLIRQVVTATLLVLLASHSVFAALGDNVSSVKADQARLKGTVRVTQAQSLEIHEITAEHGTVVREFVSPEGNVFGVAWKGQFIPDLQQLFGNYFDQYSEAAKAQKASYVGRRPLNVQLPGLVVQMSGHMRAYSGRAFLPGMLPQGVAADSIR
jgi:hypothetical protein